MDVSASPQSGLKGQDRRGIGLYNSRLTQVDEMTSECGFKEEIDRKEFQYQEDIEHLQEQIKDINLISSLTQGEIDNIMRQNEDFEMNKQLIEMRQKQIK